MCLISYTVLEDENERAIIQTEDALKTAPTSAEIEEKRLMWRLAAAKSREKKRKRLANDPIERAISRMAENAGQRKRRARSKADPNAQEKRRILFHNAYLRKKARLEADPVKKESIRIAVLERNRERRAGIRADTLILKPGKMPGDDEN